MVGVAEPGMPFVADVDPESCGTFAGFGVDIRVCLSPDASDRGAVDRAMPLTALIAGWLRDQAAPESRLRVRMLAPDTPADECARLGAALRRELDARPTPQALLVVADGANTLTDKAPGAFDARSADVQSMLDTALADGDCGALELLEPALCSAIGLSGRAAWQTLSAVFGGENGGPSKSEALYAGAPYGVGYDVGMWWP